MLKTERINAAHLARGYALGRLDELGEDTLCRRRHDLAEMFVHQYVSNNGRGGIKVAWDEFWASKSVSEHVHGIYQRAQKDDPELVALLAQEEAIDRQIYGN